MIAFKCEGRLRGVRVAALCEQDKTRLAGDWRGIQGNFGPAGEKMDLTGIARYGDLNEMLADESLDVIDITLPPGLHAEIAIQAFRAGKHVFCEKPMALTPRDCDRMAAAAAKADRLLMVGHVLPFYPEYAWAYKTIQSGKYGQLLGGSFRRDSKLAAEHASKVRSAGKLGYYWQLFAGLGWTSIHWLHKIRQPTLVLAGDDDLLIPLVNMRMLAWRIPNAQLHIIDDGHLFLITRAEAVAPIIMKFLEEERLRAVIHPRPAV
jgi:predicted dehydrogenase